MATEILLYQLNINASGTSYIQQPRTPEGYAKLELRRAQLYPPGVISEVVEIIEDEPPEEEVPPETPPEEPAP